MQFILPNKLLWACKDVIAICINSPDGSPKIGREWKLRNKEANDYITSLMRAWIKPFGFDKVASETLVAEKIREGLEFHFNNIFAKDVPLCLK